MHHYHAIRHSLVTYPADIMLRVVHVARDPPQACPDETPSICTVRKAESAGRCAMPFTKGEMRDAGACVEYFFFNKQIDTPWR